VNDEPRLLFPELGQPPPQLITGSDVETRGTLEAWATFSRCGAYRYMLGRVWNPDGALLVACMLNPSTADETALDPTLRRVRGFAQRDGYGGFLVVNCFALRSTDPRALRTAADSVGPRNDEAIVAAADGPMLALLVAGWGRPPSEKIARRLRYVRSCLPMRRHEWWVFGPMTAGGFPRHPLYLRADTPLVPWREINRKEARDGEPDPLRWKVEAADLPPGEP